MKNTVKAVILFLFLVFIFPGDRPAVTFAATGDDYSIAYINDFDGECEIKRKGESFPEEMKEIYTPLYQGDVVKTMKKAKAEIVFDDETIVKLDPNSRIEIVKLQRDKKNQTFLQLVKGRIFVIVKKLMENDEFTVKTKMAMAAVKGTEFVVTAEDEADSNDRVGVYEGKVQVSTFDMSGREREKIILDKDKETVIVKNLRKMERPTGLSVNYVKRYNEVRDLRKKIEVIREMRRSGKSKEFRLKSKLKRIENLKRMRSSPEFYNNLDSKQKALMDEMIKYEDIYQAQYDDAKKKKRNTRIDMMLEKNKAKKKAQEEE